jgi:hypothetical protein
MLSFTLVSRIVLSVVIGLLGGFIWWILDRRENWKTILIALLVGTATFGSLAGLEIIPANPVDVRITSPSTGTTVGKAEIFIAGTVSPPDARVLVLVHPVDSDRWWVQLEPSVTQPDSNQNASQWETTIYLGDETHGIGEQFEVVALGSEAALVFDILTGRYYPTGAEVDALPPLSRSNVVSLCRECQDTP